MPCQRRNRLASIVLLGLLVLLPLAPQSAHAQRTDTVVIGMAQEPDTLLGAFGSMLATTVVLDSLFAYMVQRDDQARLFARLVEKIPTLKDGDWEVLPGKKMKVPGTTGARSPRWTHHGPT